MPGDLIGWSCSCEIILTSSSPLDAKTTIGPEELARALTAALGRVRITAEGSAVPHRVGEVHVYRVAPTLTAIRAALGQPTPWVGKGRKPKSRAGARRAGKATRR
jgi:hypothetical protein